MSRDLIDLVQRLGQPRVLVVGDVMLDRYVWGDAERISQEAPVILLRAERREERLGGASSVATMLRALGARVMLAGIVGNDHDGGRVRQLLTDLAVDHEAVVTDTGRPTTVKERYVGKAQHRHPQQMLRVDHEDRRPISDGIRKQIDLVVQSHLRKCDLVLVSDYDKGVCTPGLLASLIRAAHQLKVRIIADPARGHDFRQYHGCSAITPNRLEAGLATNRVLNTVEEALDAAQALREKLDLEAAIVTLDKDGMALAAGVDYEQAIALANVAGGLEVEKIGVATVTRDEILRDLMSAGHAGAAAAPAKLLPLEVLLQELE